MVNRKIEEINEGEILKIFIDGMKLGKWLVNFQIENGREPEDIEVKSFIDTLFSDEAEIIMRAIASA